MSHVWTQVSWMVDLFFPKTQTIQTACLFLFNLRCRTFKYRLFERFLILPEPSVAEEVVNCRVRASYCLMTPVLPHRLSEFVFQPVSQLWKGLFCDYLFIFGDRFGFFFFFLNLVQFYSFTFKLSILVEHS